MASAQPPPTPRLGQRQIKYREQPFISFGSKEFLTGIAPGGAHGGGALFYKADGVTPLVEAGVGQSANNGLLMCGSSASTVGGATTGAIMISCPDTGVAYTSGGAFFSTDGGKIYKLQTDTTFVTALANIRTISSLTPGLLTFQDSSSNKWLLYRQATQIGKWDGTTFTDNWQATTTEYFGAFHQFGKYILFGNGPGAVGQINADMSVTLSAFVLPKDSQATAISDDGTYAVIATSRNSSADSTIFSDTRIVFWDSDAAAPLALRIFVIPDPFIYRLMKTPVGLFAFGVTGIWLVALSGVKKSFGVSTGVYTVTAANAIHYGRGAVTYFSDAVMWGGTSGANNALKILGQIDSNFKSAHYTPFLLTSGKNITCVDGQLLKGWIYVADSTPQLLAYPMSTSNIPQTGNTAQTTYFALKERYQINRVDVIFGVPLASGDSFSVSILKDENTAAVSVGSATFAADGATRRKVMMANAPIQVDDQFSVKLTFTAGAVKVKRVDIYGHWMNA